MVKRLGEKEDIYFIQNKTISQMQMLFYFSMCVWKAC